MRHAVLNAFGIALFAGYVGAANADAVKLGMLNCDEAAGWGLVFSSSRDLKCVFSPIDKSLKPEHYTGTIKTYGVDIGYQGGAVLLWAVASSDGKYTPGALAGSYGGVGAAAAWTAGLGSNILLGGSSQGYALQPLTIQGLVGANIAAGVVAVDLKAAP